jgi:hypothetical protein
VPPLDPPLGTAQAGVGVLIAVKWIDKVVDVWRIDDRLIMASDCWEAFDEFNIRICTTEQ